MDDPVGQRLGAVDLVRGEDHRGAGRDGVADEAVEAVAPGGVEAGVGLVEQPELGAAGQQAGQRGAAALAGRQLRDGHVGQATVSPHVSRAASMSVAVAPAARPQKRTLSATVSSS